MKKMYFESHEWVEAESNVTYTLGISKYAQDSLGDIVYIELPEVGSEIKKGAPLAVVESVKSASEIYAPFDCTVLAVNETLTDNPEKINESPLEEGWICKVQVNEGIELEGAMDQGAYDSFTEGL